MQASVATVDALDAVDDVMETAGEPVRMGELGVQWDTGNSGTASSTCCFIQQMNEIHLFVAQKPTDLSSLPACAIKTNR